MPKNGARRRGPVADVRDYSEFFRRRAEDATRRTVPEKPRGINTRAMMTLVPPSRILAAAAADPAFARWLVDFIDALPRTRPLCIGCPTVFTQEGGPAVWLLTTAPGETPRLAGICDACGATMSQGAIYAIAAASLGGVVCGAAGFHPEGGRA
jgi:hypothetical protein